MHRVIKSCYPDSKAVSFQRPESDLNKPIGLAEFLSLSATEENGNPYIKDDTILIKVTLNVNHFSLPIMLTWVPRLPLFIRQAMVTNENQRKIEHLRIQNENENRKMKNDGYKTENKRLQQELTDKKKMKMHDCK